MQIMLIQKESVKENIMICYLQSEIILLADVFENFRNTCLKIYELDSGKFLSAPGLAWQVALKKTTRN